MSLRAILAVFDRSEARLACRLVLIALADHADDHGENAWPGVETIMAKARLSRRAVQLALRKLERDGEIVPTGTSPGGTTIYRLAAAHQGGAQTLRPRGAQTVRPGGANRAPEPSFNGPRDQTTSDLASEGVSTGKPPRPSRAQLDESWDELERLFGKVAPHERTLRGKLSRDLAVAVLAEFPDVGTGGIADEIRRRANCYRRAWPGISMTDTALHRRWSVFAHDPPGVTPFDRAAAWIESVGWRLDPDDAAEILSGFSVPDDLRRGLAERLDEERRQRMEAA